MPYKRKRSIKRSKRRITDIIEKPATLSTSYEAHERIFSEANSKYIWFAENWAPLGPKFKESFAEEFLNPLGTFSVSIFSQGHTIGGTDNLTSNTPPIVSSEDAVFIKYLGKYWELKNNEPVDCVVKIHKISLKRGATSVNQSFINPGIALPTVTSANATNNNIGYFAQGISSALQVTQDRAGRLFSPSNIFTAKPVIAGGMDFQLLFQPNLAYGDPQACKMNRTLKWQSSEFKSRFNVVTTSVVIGQGQSFKFKDIIKNKKMRVRDFCPSYAGDGAAGAQIFTPQWEDGDYIYAFEITGVLGHAPDGAITIDISHAGNNDYAGTSTSGVNRAGIMPSALDISCYTTISTAFGKYTFDNKSHYLKVDGGFGNSTGGITRDQVATASQSMRPEGPANVASNITTAGIVNTAVAANPVN